MQVRFHRVCYHSPSQTNWPNEPGVDMRSSHALKTLACLTFLVLVYQHYPALRPKGPDTVMLRVARVFLHQFVHYGE